MCGICGILGKGTQKNLDDMLAAIRHRGPDDEGVYCDENIALGMRRLAIIDISPSGHQPMSNPEKTVWIIYNGEIYNFQDERGVLQKKGYQFQSSSDTEVLLMMYLEYGEAFLEKVRGMFALAIYDKRKGNHYEKLILARDPFGIKPLLFYKTKEGLVFASEMKALLKSSLIPKQLDPESIRKLFTYGNIPQPATIIKDVFMLLPGHKIVYKENTLFYTEYTSLTKKNPALIIPFDYENQKKSLRLLLEDSVSRQMISDVPIGAFLSGGIDSTAVVGLMQRLLNTQIRTFSVGFEGEGQDIDESEDAAQSANYLGTKHTKVLITGADVKANLYHFVQSIDQPTIDGANSYFISLAASQVVKVAISGTGGDELFAGYPWFIAMQKYELWCQKHPLRSQINKILGFLAGISVFDRFVFTRFYPRIELFRKNRDFFSFFLRQYQLMGPIGAACILSSTFSKKIKLGRDPSKDFFLPDSLNDKSCVAKTSLLTLQSYTQNQLLRDIDAVSMAHSLEVRVPYLDQHLLEYALALPDSAKLQLEIDQLPIENCTYRKTGAKKILIDTLTDILPKDIDQQVKRGFGMPFAEWLKGPLHTVLLDCLSEEKVRNRGIFNPTEVTKILKGFESGKEAWAIPWLLMITELWCRNIFDND